MDKDKLKGELLKGIYKYTQIINDHKGAVLERENLDSLVSAYQVVCNENESNNEFKKTLKETFNL